MQVGWWCLSSRFLIVPFSIPLYTTMGTNWSPAAVMVSAMAARLVSFVEVLITMVYLPRIFSGFLGCIEKNTGIWSMLVIQHRSHSGPWNIGPIKSWNSFASWHTSLGGRHDTFVPLRYIIECNSISDTSPYCAQGSTSAP